MKRGTAILLAVLLVVGPAAGVATYLVLERILLPLQAPPPGELALEILQDDPYPDLVVEVDWTSGVRPADGAVALLQERLATYTLKANVEVVLSGEVDTGLTTFTTRDLFELERANREFRTEGSALSLYLLYVEGTLADNENALGASTTGSSVAIFKEVVERVARQGRIAVERVEASVLVHEFGHLMGLVQLTYESDVCEVHPTEFCITLDGRRTYEDPERPFHSTNRSDVMYWAFEVRGGVPSEPPTDFGFETRYDLEQLRTGAYGTFPSRLREEAKALPVRLLVGTGEAAPAARRWGL